jgi:hypothetical protein
MSAAPLQFLLLLFAGWVNRRQQAVIDYLIEENRVLREQHVPDRVRAGLVEAEPDKFCMPDASDVRYNWVCVRLGAIGRAEMRTLVAEAWRFVVPRRVAAAHLDPPSTRSVKLATKRTKSAASRRRAQRRTG